MINEIELRNFRPHDKIKLKDLHPNLNVIIGDTGTGKTSIFRALRLLFNNEPQSGAKLYKFKEKTELFIKAIVNKHSISRKAKSYSIDKHNLTAFGKNVPEPIKEIISLQDINWQLQIQPHFLILDSGGTVAKYLNPIMGSEESDLIINKIKEQMGNLRGEFKLYNAIIKDNEKVITNLKNIGVYKKQLEKIQSHILLLQDLEKNFFSATEKLFEIRKLNSKIINTIKIKQFTNKLKEIKLSAINMNSLEADINNIEEKIEKFHSLKHISVKNYIINIEKLKIKFKKKNSLQTEVDNLESFLLSWKINDEHLEEGLEKQKKLQNEWDEKFSTLKYCLLCKQEIKNAKNHLHNGRSYKWKKSTLQVG